MNANIAPAFAASTSWAEQELLVLREAARQLGSSLDPDAVIRETLHLLSEFLGLDRGRVLLYDPARGDLAIRHAYGLTQPEIARGRFAVGEGITGRVFAAREAAIVQDIDAEPEFLCRTVDRIRLPRETVAFIALPIENGDGIIGVLGVHRLRCRDRAFADDVRILRIIATLIGQILQLNKLVAERTKALESENRQLRQALEDTAVVAKTYGIVGESPQLLAALKSVERIAATDATVLLLGESGTGKEVFARATHQLSNRRDQPFVKVNCAAIPDELFESELFGHERGAFTGATASRAGRFEQAHGGTLFLDEIGEVPPSLQAKLLRALQERVIERVGSDCARPVDVRIVAATNRDLAALVNEGRFRLDLYYRLNVVPIRLPALRERPEDIRSLARYFLAQITQAYQRNVSLAPEGFDVLVAFHWPGNVRQLHNVLERMVLLQEAGVVSVDEISTILAGEHVGMADCGADPIRPARPYRNVSETDRGRIEHALQRSGGNKSSAAQLLGMSVRQLDYRIKVLGISGFLPAR